MLKEVTNYLLDVVDDIFTYFFRSQAIKSLLLMIMTIVFISGLQNIAVQVSMGTIVHTIIEVVLITFIYLSLLSLWLKPLHYWSNTIEKVIITFLDSGKKKPIYIQVDKEVYARNKDKIAKHLKAIKSLKKARV